MSGAALFREPPPLSDDEFARIRDLVHRQFGINLTEQKRSLIQSRLQAVLRRRNLDTYAAYIDELARDGSGQALIEFVNRISTNYSFFWREPDHFELFTAQVLPWVRALEGGRQRPDLRLWVAGCSTGEEPYTLAMLIREFLAGEHGRWDAKLLATDISRRAMDEAAAGVYASERIDRLPRGLRDRWVEALDADRFRVKAEIRGDVVMRAFNLMNERFPFRGQFHAIFCRNVMIYFDKPTREALVARFVHHLRPGGWLFIGHSETIGRDHRELEFVQPAAYRKRERA